MSNISLIVSSIVLIFATNVLAVDNQQITKTLQGMIDTNLQYAYDMNERVSKESLQYQTPHSTAVLCADSRVDVRAFAYNPEGEVFTIRNIGNQVETAQGSIVYGVDYLNTELLLIIGHSGCGAVKAALAGYQSQNPKLQQELNTLRVDPKASLNQNIVFNVNQQVYTSVKQFQSKIDSGDLVVIGMVYDLHNDYNYGSGALILVNVNNITDPVAIAALPFLNGLDKLVIMDK